MTPPYNNMIIAVFDKFHNNSFNLNMRGILYQNKWFAKGFLIFI